MSLEQEPEPDELPVWPENSEAVELFQRCLTQWSLDPSGMPYGLRYEAVSVQLRIHVPRARWAEVMDDLLVMEFAALVALRKKE